MTGKMILQVTKAAKERTMHVLLEDDVGRLAVRRLRPWHLVLARCLAPRLDRQLAEGARPEQSPALAARALQMTSMAFRRDLAASLRRIPAAPAAQELRELARRLTAPGPVPVRGVAIVAELLADGGGPLYRRAGPDDLGTIIRLAAEALVGV
jgi:hypothetical protein